MKVNFALYLFLRIDNKIVNNIHVLDYLFIYYTAYWNG